MTQSAGRSRRARDGRPRLTGRAAILAVVLCAIALSLAYPVREYIAQRRQIDELLMQQRRIAAQARNLRAQRHALTTPAYIERVARDELHMCLPTQTCYVIVGATSSQAKNGIRRSVITPWYERLWSSVQQANSDPAAGAGRSPASRAHRAGAGAARGSGG